MLWPGQLGARAFDSGRATRCSLKTLIDGAPITITALLHLPRLAPLGLWRAGFAVGGAAGGIPESLVQLACISIPSPIVIRSAQRYS
jgi:hypothetical protein